MRFQVVNEGCYASDKLGAGSNQAQDQPAGFRHAEEVAGMDPDAAVEQLADGLLVGLERGYAEDGVPAAFDFEALRGGYGGELAVELGEVSGGAGFDLLLDRAAACEPGGQRILDGGVHGEKGVGDDLQAGEGFAESGASRGNPCGFHLRQAGNLAEAADDED